MVIKNEELLRSYAPAAFAEAPEDGQVSSRYSFLPTTDILEILQDEGWTTWKAQQVNPRKWSRGHAKHIIRLRHEDMTQESFGVGDSFPEMLLINAHNGTGSYTLQGGIFRMICSNGMVISESDFGKIHIRHIGFEAKQVQDASRKLVMNSFGVGDSFPEMLLMNAHNGTGAYDLMGGIFRMVCSNGMVISESDFGKIHIRHIGFEPEQVVEASRELIMNASNIADKIGSWQEIELSPRSRQDFFTDAAKIRFENPDEGVVQDMSKIRREADRGLDLWSTFNVAQENLIRGGFVNGSTGRNVRPITSIQKDVKFNSELWDLASQYSVSMN